MNAKIFIPILLLASTPAFAQAQQPQMNPNFVIDQLLAADDATPKVSAAPKAVSVSVDLVASPTTGTCGYMTNLSWTALNASVCTKSGAWQGNAAASGSETLQVNSSSATFTLTCSSSTDSRTVTWTNPTTNIDGSTAQLSGNKVFHSASAATIESANAAISLVPAKTTYVLSGLPAGPRVIGVKATGSSGVDSAMSPLASVNITLPVGADTVQAACTPNPEPRPPSAVTISSTVWDTKGSVQGASIKVGTNVGVIELGVLCRGEAPVINEGTDNAGNPVDYWELDKNLTRIRPGVKPRPGILVGRCELRPAS